MSGQTRTVTVSDMVDSPVMRPGTDQHTGTSIDVLIDTRGACVAYVAIAPSDPEATRAVIVPRASLAYRDGTILADIDDAAAESPAGDDDGDAEDPVVPLAAMPPLVIGPFGSVVAPTMAGALFNDMAMQQHPDPPEIDKTNRDWYWFAALRGLPLFDASGPLGHLEDITLDPDTLRCLALCAKDERGRLQTYGFDRLRHVSEQGESIILELSDTPPYSPDAIAADKDADS